MLEFVSRPLAAKIVDFCTSRLNDAEAVDVPQELRAFVADKRQYPFNIARHFPDGITWFSPNQPWFFRSILSDEEKLSKLKEGDAFILSGSGMSAYYFQEGNYKKFEPEDVDYLKKTQEIVKEQLGAGKWVLGICFGGQLAVGAVGGKLGRLPIKDNGKTVTEAGWLGQALTDAGKEDPVFNHLSETFFAPHFHSDYVAELPKVGTVIETASGRITVVKAEKLAVRKGYLDTEGLKNIDTEYIQASVVEFDNGAKLYQIQPHPEMATPDKANFLIRQNPWLRSEMGEEYYQQASKIPQDADFSLSRVITSFVEQARGDLEKRWGVTFLRSLAAQNLDQFIPYLLA
jgi:GMP synthase-like glutamine amidotransferase